MYNTDDELFLTRAPIDTAKPSSQPDTSTSSSPIYTPRNASTSALSPSTSLPAASTSSSKIHKRIESMQEGVYNMRSECVTS